MTGLGQAWHDTVNVVNRHETGRKLYAEVMTKDAPEDGKTSTAGLIDFVFGEVWTRPGLSRRDRRFVTLACVAAADADAPLEQHVYAALNGGGISFYKTDELALHFSPYYGFAKGQRLAQVTVEQQERVLAEADDPSTRPE